MTDIEDHAFKKGFLNECISTIVVDDVVRACNRPEHAHVYLTQEAMDLAEQQRKPSGSVIIAQIQHEERVEADRVSAARAKTAAGIDKRLHSRACGILYHEHGSACSRDCPTCGGDDDNGEVRTRQIIWVDREDYDALVRERDDLRIKLGVAEFSAKRWKKACLSRARKLQNIQRLIDGERLIDDEVRP